MGSKEQDLAPSTLKKLFSQHIDIDYENVVLRPVSKRDEADIVKALSALSKDYPYNEVMDEKSATDTAHSLLLSEGVLTLYDSKDVQFVGFIGFHYFQVSQEQCAEYFLEEMTQYQMGKKFSEERGVKTSSFEDLSDYILQEQEVFLKHYDDNKKDYEEEIEMKWWAQDLYGFSQKHNQEFMLEVSYYLHPNYTRKGIGPAAVSRVIDILKKNKKEVGIVGIVAGIHHKNTPSLKLCKRLKFSPMHTFGGENDVGEIYDNREMFLSL